MSYATEVLGAYSGAGYAAEALGIYATDPTTVTTWAGWRKVLTTDQYGHIVGQQIAITDLVVGDSYDVLLSGPFNPATTIQSATLYVDTPADVNVCNATAVVALDGSSGAYAISFHLTSAQTALLTAAQYLYSVKIVDSGGNAFTPINGVYLLPNPSLAR